MPLNLRSSKKQRTFDLPVSYRINEERDRLRDALNVFSQQGRLETRYGRSIYNSVLLDGNAQSISFFKHANGTRYIIAKVGTTLVSVSHTGAHTTLKTGLSSLTKHRGITWARGISSRHIISIETDGLFQFDGTNFCQLGQDAPSTPTLAATTGALANKTWKTYLTFYSSATGFETNPSTASNSIATTAQGLLVSAIPTTADNLTIDKVRIYLKDTALADDPIYAGEVNLGTTTFSIALTLTSTETYPLSNAKPLSGGGKFLTEFNRRLVYAGNDTYRNDVFFSEEDLPDAFNDGNGPNRLVLSPIHDGPITGIATGLYNNTVLDPYLVIFKARSIHVYSEIGGVDNGKLIPISSSIGCVSFDTIKTKNGNIYFLSYNGWRVIENGRLVVDQKSNPATLGLGDIDDIFTSPGYLYEANKSQLYNAFSVYYSTLDQYMTWVCEGAETDFKKAYVYEFKVGGFKPYQFHSAVTCACVGEDGEAVETVYMADANGRIYSHSVAETRSDVDELGVSQPITSFAIMTWMDGDDLDASYNFRELILRRTAGVGDLTVKSWVNYTMDSVGEFSEIVSNPLKGFVLDVSSLDLDAFGSDSKTIITSRTDINRCGENLLVGFYQSGTDLSIGLISSQIDYNKNGNRNE